MDEVFTSADLCNIKTRSSSYKLILPHCNKASGHNAISSLGPRLWNILPSAIKLYNNPNSFKHKVKMHFLEVLEKETDDSFSTTNNIFSSHFRSMYQCFKFLL